MNNRDNKRLENLSHAFLCLKTPKEVQSFLHDLLSAQERQTVPLRWAAAQGLHKGKRVREIAKEVGCSPYVVSRVNAVFREGAKGYDLVLTRMGNSR